MLCHARLCRHHLIAQYCPPHPIQRIVILVGTLIIMVHSVRKTNCRLSRQHCPVLSQSLENCNRDEGLQDLYQSRDTGEAAVRRREARVAAPQRQLQAPDGEPPSPATRDPPTGAQDDALG